MPKIDLFNLGTVGVDLTRSVVHADDGSLRSAQNAVPDMRGEAGGLAKRDGLVALNSTTVGGSVLGAVHTPLPSIRTHYLWQNTTTDGSYFSSTDLFATTTETETTSSTEYEKIPQQASQLSELLESAVTPNVTDIWYGRPFTVWNGKAVFVNYRYQQAFTALAVSVFDGSVFRELLQIPVNPDVGTAGKAVLSLLAEGSYLYIAVWDAGTAFASHKGSVYQCEPVTGTFTKLGATFPTGYVPSCLTWYLGRLWAGTYSEDKTKSGRVYWIRPGVDSAWTLDHTTTAGQGEILDLAVYKGELYAATRGSSGTAALVLKRTTLGVWSTSLTGYSTDRDQYFLSLVTFGSHLYASYTEYSASARISRFDGSSWSTVNDSPSAMQHWVLSTDGTTLFVVETGGFSDNELLLTSTNGTSYTDRSTPLLLAGGSSQHLQPHVITLFR